MAASSVVEASVDGVCGMPNKPVPVVEAPLPAVDVVPETLPAVAEAVDSGGATDPNSPLPVEVELVATGVEPNKPLPGVKVAGVEAGLDPNKLLPVEVGIPVAGIDPNNGPGPQGQWFVAEAGRLPNNPPPVDVAVVVAEVVPVAENTGAAPNKPPPVDAVVDAAASQGLPAPAPKVDEAPPAGAPCPKADEPKTD